VGPQERGDDELEAELEHWFSLCQKDDCTVVLLSKKNFDIYAKIKRVGDFLGHHTICAIENKIKDGKPNEIGGFCWQHFSNMALKVNLKLGGDNHWLNDDDLNEVLVGELRNNTMILGSDVTHPGHGAKIGYPSIACVVGTVDAKFMSYRGSMRLQAGGQEQIDEANLCSMIMERLETWKSNNNERLPTTILFYRDGVSESQFAAVEKLEIPQIKEAYKKAGGKPDQLRVCFLVVSKRHHTRFYAADKEASYKSKGKINGNVKAGLLVDDIVTAPKPTKFFLQSHCAIKGTARSAHYYVLRNDTNISEANLKQLTMMLCYTFGRSTTGVSYATPAYVADRLCDRGRSYIRLWAENEYAKPVFTYKKYYGADGTERKATDKEILDEKNAMVKKFLHSPVWGDNYEDDPNMPQRLNPWHPNLDDGMFWM
jgi:eukaryotic translation initiation factor 2C